MPRQPFLMGGYDYLRALDIGFLAAGTRSASPEFFHFIRDMGSPLEPIAPIIHSGSKPRAKLLVAFSDSSFFLFGLLSSPYLPNQNQLCACLPLIYLSRVLFSMTAETQ